MLYMTLIYDYFNVLTRIEESETITKAEKKGQFYTKRGGWWTVVKPENEDEKQMYYSLLNI